MPRKKSPDAKDITMSARFSGDEAAAIDAERGATDRSVWLRSAAPALLAAEQPRPQRAGVHRGGKPAAEVPPPPPVPTGSVTPERQRCTHQGTRVIGGWCGQCQHVIKPGGLWA